MNRILKQEIKHCDDCPYSTYRIKHKIIELECLLTGDIAKTQKQDDLINHKLIDSLAEQICPLPHKEPVNKYYQGLVYHEQ